jgi:hypothetical protein
MRGHSPPRESIWADGIQKKKKKGVGFVDRCGVIELFCEEGGE